MERLSAVSIRELSPSPQLQRVVSADVTETQPQAQPKPKPQSAFPVEGVLFEATIQPQPDARYATGLGLLSFEELITRTSQYAAVALRQTYQVNEMDLDDGLQAGHLRLWQRLQKQPDLLADKPLAWIAKGVIYSALHATRGNWLYHQRTQSHDEAVLNVGKGKLAYHSRESRQTDLRLDLHQAIQTVAEQILQQKRRKRRDQELWALYGLTMLQVGSDELSRLFGVREQSMGQAYARVRGYLQKALPNYAPKGATRAFRQRGRDKLPEQDLRAIRQDNDAVPEGVYATVLKRIQTLQADTQPLDELALAGIRQSLPSTTQAKQHGVAQWRMQRAYQRVHLLIGAERDPDIRIRRPERRLKSIFTLTEETTKAVQRLALELLEQPRSYEKLVALHAHIGNLAISTTAKHFSIPTSTLRYYAQHIARRLGTPTRPAREVERTA